MAAMYGGHDGSKTFNHLFIVELGRHSVVSVITCWCHCLVIVGGVVYTDFSNAYVVQQFLWCYFMYLDVWVMWLSTSTLYLQLLSDYSCLVRFVTIRFCVRAYIGLKCSQSGRNELFAKHSCIFPKVTFCVQEEFVKICIMEVLTLQVFTIQNVLLAQECECEGQKKAVLVVVKLSIISLLFLHVQQGV